MRLACAVPRDGDAERLAVASLYREARMRGDTRGANVVVECGDHFDFLHFPVGASHSEYIRSVEVPLPFKVVIKGYRGKSVKKLISWMYFGQLNFSAQHIGEYLALSALLGTVELHARLERTLVEMAECPGMLVFCMNTARESRCKVSKGTSQSLAGLFGGTRVSLSLDDIDRLSFDSVASLVAYPNFPFDAKLRITNIALLWLTRKRDVRFVNAILDAMCFGSLSAAASRFLVWRLKRLLVSEGGRRVAPKVVSAYSNDGVNVNVSAELLPQISSNRFTSPDDTSKSSTRSRGRSCSDLKRAGERSDSTSPRYRAEVKTPPGATNVPRLFPIDNEPAAGSRQGSKAHSPSTFLEKPMAVPLFVDPPSPVSRSAVVDRTRVRDLTYENTDNTGRSCERTSPAGTRSSETENAARSSETVNRYTFSSESLVEIEATPDPFGQETVSTASKIPSEGSLKYDHDGFSPGTVPQALQGGSAYSELTPDSRDVFSPSEIVEINAHPDIVDANFVIGKKLFSAEELEDLRAIAPLCHCSRNEILNAMPCHCRRFSTIGTPYPDTHTKHVSSSTSTMGPNDHPVVSPDFHEGSAGVPEQKDEPHASAAARASEGQAMPHEQNSPASNTTGVNGSRRVRQC